MSERNAFIRSICEEPEDDVRRLAFADWLDENGSDREAWRAAMIRGQWDAAGPSRWITTFPDVATLASELRANVWVDGFDRTDIRDARRVTLHICNGFLSSLSLPTETFVQENFARRLFSAHPITAVSLTDRVSLHLPAVYEGRHVRPADVWTYHATVHWLRVDTAGVPWEIWDHYPAAANIGVGRDTVPGRCRAKEFESPEDAHDWLSSLFVAYGRSLVGLPPLTAPARTPSPAAPDPQRT